MINHSDVMTQTNGWMGGRVWIWTIVVLVVLLLVVTIIKRAKK